MSEFNPGLILMVGALLIPVLPGLLRSLYMLALPVAAFVYLIGIPIGAHGELQLFDMALVTFRVDKLSLVFGYIFLLAAFLGVIYALHVGDWLQHTAGLIYAGAAIGAVFAGDLITLFVCWEATAVASVFLIWASGTERAYASGMRYLIIQIGSGVILLAGILFYYRETGSIAFNAIGIETLAGQLILVAFGIKCAFPLLHNWLQDAYPEATVTGTVMLSAFTTKLAVYALARGYAGTDILIPIGATMTAFPIFYAVIENDLRKVLAYSLNNQLGFMVVGIGIGTEMSVNGAAAHAFCHIIYKALLFMSMGAVLHRVGTAKGSELGGLYRSMPWTTGFCIVGAASISAFPLFSGFVSKGLIIAAAIDEGLFWTWIVLLFASAGVVEHAGIKVPYFAFFAHDSGKRCKEAPLNMLIAMGLAAFLCIAIGIVPDPLYAILPYNVDFHPYTLEHIVTQLQLLMLAILGVVFLIRSGLYPPETPSINLDTDWFYRKLGSNVGATLILLGGDTWKFVTSKATAATHFFERRLHHHHNPEGILGRTWPTGTMAFWATVMLGGYLLIFYFR